MTLDLGIVRISVVGGAPPFPGFGSSAEPLSHAPLSSSSLCIRIGDGASDGVSREQSILARFGCDDFLVLVSNEWSKIGFLPVARLGVRQNRSR
jgi:hypothetical protein